MTRDWTNAELAARAVADPTTAGADLVAIAAARPTARTTATPPAAPRTPRPTSTPTPTCGVTLPDGVSSALVCSSPAATVTLPGFTTPDYLGSEIWYGFKSPTGNLACAWYDGGTVLCNAVVLETSLPVDPRSAGVEGEISCARGLWVGDQGAGVMCAGDVRVVDVIPMTPTVPVLEYGQIAVSTDYPYPWTSSDAPHDPVACQSSENGVICWNTQTHHGMKLSRQTAVYW
jgi:hypothetical protein